MTPPARTAWTLPLPLALLASLAVVAASASGQDAPATAASPASEPAVFEFGLPMDPGRLGSRVVDRAGRLDDEQIGKINRTFERARENYGTSLYFATFGSLTGQEFIMDRARALSTHWLDDERPGAVLVYVHDIGRFAISGSRALLEYDGGRQVEELAGQYQQLLEQRGTTANALREAAADFEFTLRQLTQREQRRRQGLQTVQRVAIGGALLLVAVVGVVVVRELHNYNHFSRKLELPHANVSPRLGGSRCGGNIAVVNYRDPQ